MILADAIISPSLVEMDSWGEHARVAKTMLILFQVAALLGAAKLMGWLAERVRVPGVVGELLAGVIIGPYVLGHLITIPLHGHMVPLFPAPLAGQWPVNDIVWSVAQFASIILLFLTGLHTDLQQFLKYVGPASLVAVIGLVAPFGLGAAAVYYIPPFAELASAHSGSTLVPALFVGAILAATSIGITARVLSDVGKLDTPEGVTILGAAVLDDVLGIIALAIVGGIATTGAVSAGAIGGIAGKAFGFWIGLTLVTLVLAKPLERFLTSIKYAGAMVGLALALAFIASGLAESFGLAFIIGAYSFGLGLSRTKMAHKLMEGIDPIGHFFVPIFFATLGTLVNIQSMFASPAVIAFGLVISALAIIGKLAGCGLAALPVGFNGRGAYRIGLGMMPRGEVALIVAGVGLSGGLIGETVFGVSIMMTLITTILAPILLVPAFAKGGSGRKAEAAAQSKLPGPSTMSAFEVRLERSLLPMFVDRLVETAERGGWQGSYDREDAELHLLRNEGAAAQISVKDDVVHIDASDTRMQDFVTYAAQVREGMERDAKQIEIATPGPTTTA